MLGWKGFIQYQILWTNIIVSRQEEITDEILAVINK